MLIYWVVMELFMALCIGDGSAVNALSFEHFIERLWTEDLCPIDVALLGSDKRSDRGCNWGLDPDFIFSASIKASFSLFTSYSVTYVSYNLKKMAAI